MHKLTRLKNRRVVQSSLAYLAAGWVLLQVFDLVADRFVWPATVMRAAIILVAAGFFVTFVIAWFHGERGHQKIHPVEILLIALIVIAAGVVVALVAPASAGTGARAASPEGRSLAVLPFSSLATSKENEYFSDGMTDEITAHLARLDGLTVTSRTSAMQYKGVAKPVAQIGRELGVDHVLEGSVQRAGNRVRIVAQLIDARTDKHLWAETYDRELADVFAVQGDIARRIAESLQMRLTPQQKTQLAAVPTENLTAHDYYLQAQAYYNESWRRGSVVSARKAIPLYRQAIELDPNYALAHAGLASAHALAGGNRHAGSRDSVLHHARIAVKLDPNLPEGRNALARALFPNTESALVELRRAVELAPSYADALERLANTLLARGELLEALQVGHRLIKVSPMYVPGYEKLADIYARLGATKDAERYYQHGRTFDADNPYLLDDLGHLYYARGDKARADSLWSAMISANNETGWMLEHARHQLLRGDTAAGIAAAAGVKWSDFYFGVLYADIYYLALRRQGRSQEAEALLSRFDAFARQQLAFGDDLWFPHRVFAEVAALRGQRDQAVRHLHTAVAKGFINTRDLRESVGFESLRGYPPFEAVIQQIEQRVRVQSAALR